MHGIQEKPICSGTKREEEREITRNCLVESYSFLLNFDIMGGVFLTSR
jgi:hypothetical protein